jgi:calcium-dependent protein kinase
MSEKEVERLGELFRKIDINHDGFISIEELKLSLSDETAWFDMKELKALMDSIDVDKNGRINYTEFLASSLAKEDLFTTSNILKLFKLLDKDGNGFIDREELKSLFFEQNVDQINGKSIDEIINQCDKDNSGTIDF